MIPLPCYGHISVKGKHNIYKSLLDLYAHSDEQTSKKSSLNKVQRVKPLAALRRGGDFICFFCLCANFFQHSFLKVEPQS